MTTQLTPADLQRYVAEQSIAATLITDIGDTPTVPAAAAALGVAPEQIIKTLLFLVEESKGDETSAQAVGPTLVVVISNGESRVDKRPLAEHFGVGKKRIKLAPASVVLEQLGYPAGGVPPFGHRTSVPVILDAAVIQLAASHNGVIFGGGGDDRTMLQLTVAELQRATQALVLAVSA